MCSKDHSFKAEQRKKNWKIVFLYYDDNNGGKHLTKYVIIRLKAK